MAEGAAGALAGFPGASSCVVLAGGRCCGALLVAFCACADWGQPASVDPSVGWEEEDESTIVSRPTSVSKLLVNTRGQGSPGMLLDDILTQTGYCVSVCGDCVARVE